MMPRNTANSRETLPISVWLKRYFRQYALLLILLMMIGYLSIASPYFLTWLNFKNLLRQISFVGVAAMGMTFIIIAGQIDLSIGSIAACAGMIASSLIKDFNWMVFPSVFVGICVGFVLGASNGIMVAKLRIPAFIATVIMMNFASGIAYVYKKAQPVYDLPENFTRIATGNVIGIPNLAIILAVIFLICFFALKYTVFGRRVYAVGGSSKAADYSGIRSDNMILVLFIVMGMLSALVGMLYAARAGAADPGVASSLAIDAIAAVVMGGTSIGGGIGGVIGSLIGAIIIGLINNALVLLNVSIWYQSIVKAVVIFIAVFIDRLNHKGQ